MITIIILTTGFIFVQILGFIQAIKIEKARKALIKWQDTQRHDKCWYYPDIFNELCQILDVEYKTPKSLPPYKEFTEGCKKYQYEVYRDYYGDSNETHNSIPS